MSVISAEGPIDDPRRDDLAISMTPPKAPDWLANRRSSVQKQSASVVKSDAAAVSQPSAGDALFTFDSDDLPSKPRKRSVDRIEVVRKWIEGLKKNRATVGTAISLMIHSSILTILAFCYISHISQQDPVSVWGMAGDIEPNGSDVTLDTGLPSDAGESGPIQMIDLSQSLDSASAKSDFGQSQRSGFGGPGNGVGDGEEGTGTTMHTGSLKLPGHAQTKGSFSAWTEPRDPIPGRKYEILIQLRLPSKVTKYRGSDLSGSVEGTDNYRKTIRFRSTDLFPVENGVVEIRIEIPGAHELVRDTIHVESKILREKQTFEIVF